MTDWHPEQFDFNEADFCGKARLFPLPDFVLFPHVMHPLHIFEPRYRDMVRDALATDRLIATARLAPGWETEYENRPAVAPIACLGKIVSEHRLDDGRFNILLLGLRRIELARELETPSPFRVAQVNVLHDRVSKTDRERRRCLRKELLTSFQGALPLGEGAKSTISSLLQKHVPLGILVDLIAFTADLNAEFKQALLAETNVVARAEALLEGLSRSRRASPRAWPQALGEFPPSFSAN
jgi:Lon protease-like protein